MSIDKRKFHLIRQDFLFGSGRTSSAHNDMAFWKKWKEEVWFGPKDEEDEAVQQPKNQEPKKKKKKKKKTKTIEHHEDDTPKSSKNVLIHLHRKIEK